MGETRRKKRFYLFFKRTAVAMIMIAMLLQPLPGMLGNSVRSAEAAVYTGDYIDLENSNAELYVGTDWAGAKATSSVTGSAITIAVNNFGTGGSNDLWGLQYIVKDLGLKKDTKYQVDFDITSTVDKEVFVKLDDSGLIAEAIHLTAGVPYHYSKESSVGTPSADKQFLYIALGRTGSEAGSLSGVVGIEDIKVKEAVNAEDYIDLQHSNTELYAGTDWAGAKATSSVTGSAITIAVDNFGTAGSEWGLQYIIKDLLLKNNTKYKVEFDITSSINKDVYVKLDDKGNFINKFIHLTAGEKYHYSEVNGPGAVSTDKPYFFFALGQTSGEAGGLSGTVTIENITLQEFDDSEVATDITVNKAGTGVKFQLANNAVNTSAKAYYAVCASEAEANLLNTGDKAFKQCAMTKKTNGIWEVSDTVALTNGQVIRYYFDKDGKVTTPANYTYSVFVAADYTYDNRTDLEAGGYNLVWKDEFDGTDLDLSKWSFQLGTKDPNGGPDYWGNNEQEYYTDKNYTVKDGKLVISAKKEAMGDRNYTSTRIRTKTDVGNTLFATKYGRIEARMKLPVQEGLWPAFWMLPADTSIYGTWAASGELDIMEARGRVPDRIGGTAHFGSQWPNNTYYGKEKTFDATTDISGYHLYSFEWEPGILTWLVDDVPYFTTGNFWSKGTGNAENYAYGAPFDVPFYLILNLAVGGTFDGDAKLENAEFPAAMEVDYVRVFKKSDAYYQNMEDNLTAPDTSRDKASFESPSYQPTGVNGDYVKDTELHTLKTVTEVKPDDASWQFFVGDFGGEAVSVSDTLDGKNYAKVSATKGGNQSYAVQLIKHFPFANGYTYEISFDAKASGNRDFLLKPCGDGDNGWAGYGVSKTVSLTNTMTHFTHQFTMDKDSDPTSRLEFDLGLATGDVWIGNVTVKQVEPEQADNTDIFKNPETNGGNHIYNGSFDQGIGRLAYWHTQNVTVRVPGVINPVHNASTGDAGDFSHRAVVTANDNNAKLYQKGVWLQQSDIYQLGLNLSSDKATKVTAALTNIDGSKVYMKQVLDITEISTRKDYTLNFAMEKGITDKEAVFTLTFEKGTTVTLDNIRLIKTTNNNVAIDYSGVDLEPIKTSSTGWVNNLNNGTVTPAVNQDGVITSQTLTNSLNYMSMLYIPVSVKKGITYHLSFQAKSQFDNSALVNIQEDNSWAVTLEQTLNLKADSWQEFNYTINSTLTNGSNPIYLKFLLSGPSMVPGSFMVKDVSMTAEVQEGAKDAPADTVLNTSAPVKGKDYVIELKNGDYKTSFLDCVEKPARKALIMVNGSALADGSVKEGKIVIPASMFAAGAYRIELALDGFNNIVLTGTARDDNSQGGNNSGGNNNAGDNGTPDTQLPKEDTKLQEPEATPNKGETQAIGFTVTKANIQDNKAVAEVALDQVMNAITDANLAAKQLKGKTATVEIRVEAPTTTNMVETSIPVEALKQAAKNKIGILTISTPVAAISFDAEDLTTLSGTSGADVVITAARVEEANLSKEAKQLIGDRPVFSFRVANGDQTISQFAKDVTVTVPYTPKEGEDTNAIVIYYINDKGEPVTVRNCAYHPETGTISFNTNHFSEYAIGYHKISFKDVPSDASYSIAVDFVSARGIMEGIGKGTFNPKAKVTRGEFLVTLMKAYDIAQDKKPKNNFADAGTTSYAGYLSAAKRLGLCGKVTNNKFVPEKEITRQEMAVLAYNALKAIDKLPQGDTGKELSTYSDSKLVSASSKKAVALMTKTGIIGGSGKKLSPKAEITRAEAAQVIYNLLMK